MDSRLKKIIFKKLNRDLEKCEIIFAENQSIWFIDRASKYWYFELEKSGKLWWRYEFFTDFFIIFDLENKDFQPILSQWVEGILNRGVASSNLLDHGAVQRVERLLNSEVITSVEVGLAGNGVTEGVLNHGYRKGSRKVKEVLNREIKEIVGGELFGDSTVAKVLNIDINETVGTTIREPNQIIEVMNREDMLNHNISSISPTNEQSEFVQDALLQDLIYNLPRGYGTENPLGYVVESSTPLDTPAYDSVNEVLSYKVNRTIPDMSESLVEVQRLLDSNE